MTALAPLNGHLAPGHRLSPQPQFGDLRALGRWLSAYADPTQDLWCLDTQRLPRSLRRARHRFRAFAETQLRPRAMQLDLAAHVPAGETRETVQQLLVQAGKAGMFGEALPRPLGSAAWSEFAHSLGWKFSLMTEEFAAVDGGLMLLLCAHYLGLMPVMLASNAKPIMRAVLPAMRACRAGDPQLFAYAITEPAGGSDVEDGHGAQSYNPGVVARRVTGGWSLSGRKCFISGGDIAEYVVVFAALAGEGLDSWTGFLVRRGSPGFRAVRTELKMGMRASSAAELEFDQVFVADSDLIGRPREGWTLNRATLNLSRFPVAAMGIGLARGACQTALEFCQHTSIGGRRLLDYQEIQLQIADMVAAVRSMRAALWQMARHNRRPRQLEASLCKFHFTDRAQQVCEQALELVSNEQGQAAYWIEKALRDVRLTRIFEGTNQINRLALIEDWQPRLLRSRDGADTCGV